MESSAAPCPWGRTEQLALVAPTTHRLVLPQVLFTLGQSPRWASQRPNEEATWGVGVAAPPKRLADWIAFVRALARRYRGRIHAYEVRASVFVRVCRVAAGSTDRADACRWRPASSRHSTAYY